MADVTLSSFPYNGGTAIATSGAHMCRLTTTRFFAIYGQRTPSYTIGQVFTVSDVTAATPTVSVLRTQVISGFDTLTASSGFRVLRLNDTDVLVQQEVLSTQLTMRVVRIDPSTNVMTQVGNTLTITKYSSDTIYDNQNATGGGVSPDIDNVCLVPVLPTSTTFNLLRVTWDTGTSTLASSVVVNISIAAPTYSHCTFNKNRAGDKWVIGVSRIFNYLSTFINAPSQATGSVYIGDPASANSWTPVISSIAIDDYSTGHMNYLALTDTTGLVLYKHAKWRYWNGSTLGAEVQFGNASPNAFNETVYTTWLDQNHFLVETMADTTGQNSYAPATSRYVSVCKYTDPTFGEMTANTSTYTATLTTSTMGQFMWHNAMRDRYDNSTLLYFTPNVNTTVSTSTQFRVRALYAAP